MVVFARIVMLAAVLGWALPAGAQSPAAPATPEPATPVPAAPAAPAPPAAAPAAPAPDAAHEDPFGVEVTMPEKTIVFFRGNGNWDAAFETIVDAFKTVNAFIAKQGLKPNGPAMTIYTATDDTSFSFQAAVPVVELPKEAPRGDIGVGKSPGGKALKFIHRGSYDSMDTTYEAITNHLDEKQLDAKDLFIEEYQTDPVATPEDKLVVEVYVPIR
jgi:effector-binding domain-containing protein